MTYYYLDLRDKERKEAPTAVAGLDQNQDGAQSPGLPCGSPYCCSLGSVLTAGGKKKSFQWDVRILMGTLSTWPYPPQDSTILMR